VDVKSSDVKNGLLEPGPTASAHRSAWLADLDRDLLHNLNLREERLPLSKAKPIGGARWLDHDPKAFQRPLVGAAGEQPVPGLWPLSAGISISY
jgi:hypothetical protein